MGESYKVGKVTAKNFAIGHRAKAGDRTYSDSDRAEALRQIRQLIGLLSVHAGELKGSTEIRADAESVETALRKRKLNRARIESLVHKITGALAGVTAFANAVDAVQTAVSHLFR